MKKLVSTFVFRQRKIYSIFFISQLFCQNTLILNGKTKQPLPEVNVFSSNYGTTTDSNGTFSSIEFQEDDLRIIVTSIGNCTRKDISDLRNKIKIQGKEIDYLPAAVEDQLKIKPIYKTFPGWKISTNGIKNIDDLPDNAKNYIY